jgi:hypothetical protein
VRHHPACRRVGLSLRVRARFGLVVSHIEEGDAGRIGHHSNLQGRTVGCNGSINRVKRQEEWHPVVLGALFLSTGDYNPCVQRYIQRFISAIGPGEALSRRWYAISEVLHMDMDIPDEGRNDASYVEMVKGAIAAWRAETPGVTAQALGVALTPVNWLVHLIIPQSAIEGVLGALIGLPRTY